MIESVFSPLRLTLCDRAPSALSVFNHAYGGRIETYPSRKRPGTVFVEGGRGAEILPTRRTLANL